MHSIDSTSSRAESVDIVKIRFQPDLDVAFFLAAGKGTFLVPAGNAQFPPRPPHTPRLVPKRVVHAGTRFSGRPPRRHHNEQYEDISTLWLLLNFTKRTNGTNGIETTCKRYRKGDLILKHEQGFVTAHGCTCAIFTATDATGRVLLRIGLMTSTSLS